MSEAQSQNLIASLTPKDATREEYAAVNAFWNQVQAETFPDDPPVPLEERIRRLQTIPATVDYRSWYAWREGRSQVIAGATVRFLLTGENRHLVDFEITVLPEYRRQGLARRLLRHVVEVPRQEGRRLMMSWTTSTVPAGEAFLRHLGAQMGLATHTNQLDLHEVDRHLLEVWQARAAERASGIDLGEWTQGYPEEYIELVAAAFESMNRAPRGTLDLEDWHWTPAQIREFEASQRARGIERWSMFTRDLATGVLAGMTEVVWHPNRPTIVRQEMTGVLPAYQGRGLGRWLKAAMLEKILRERPQVRWIRTGNADSNAAMLKINRELGFKPFRSHWVWQIETEKVLAYLEQSAHRV